MMHALISVILAGSFAATLIAKTKMVLTVAVGLTLVILVHEWGHFVMARTFKVKVLVFSIVGIGPRLFGWKRGDTDYRVSMFPVGAYVRMAGDDEPQGRDEHAPESERTGAAHEFLSKPRWQRALIAIGGPGANVVAAIVLTIFLFAWRGVPELAEVVQPAVIAGVYKNSPAAQAGVQAGDRLVEVDGHAIKIWEDALLDFRSEAHPGGISAVYERSGQKIHYTLSLPAPNQGLSALFGYPIQPFTIAEATAGMPAAKAGLAPADEVLTFNGQPVQGWLQFVQDVEDSAGQPINLVVRRGQQQVPLSMQAVQLHQPDGTLAWRIGVVPALADIFRPLPIQKAFLIGFTENGRYAAIIVSGIAQLITGRVSLKELEGPVGISRHAGRAAELGLPYFIQFLALISLNLALVNLLPIPILDGGQLLLLGMEGTLRREFSLAFKERFLQVGLVFILLIFVIVMYNDVWKLVPARWLS
jgi:regulator of sigma E protease